MFFPIIPTTATRPTKPTDFHPGDKVRCYDWATGTYTSDEYVVEAWDEPMHLIRLVGMHSWWKDELFALVSRATIPAPPPVKLRPEQIQEEDCWRAMREHRPNECKKCGAPNPCAYHGDT